MKKYLKYIQVAFVALALAACSEDYLDVNTDPNNPTSVSPDLVLSTAQVQTARVMYLDRYANTLGNLFMVNWSQADGYSWYYDEFNYLVTPSFYSQIWDYSYLNPLKNYTVLTDLEGETYDNYKAIAMIMKSFHFQMLVDAYGDVPYFEALKRGENPTPKYDDAQLIYEDLIVKIDDAISLIKNADSDDLVPESDDVVFGGDMNSWIQFGNTLKLRILMRQSEMGGRAGYIQQHVDDIVAEGSGFLTTGAMINPGYTNEESKQNPFYASYGLTVTGELQNNTLATAASEYAIDYLQATSDPRIDWIYEKPDTGHLGVPQG
ncbi:MAG TPA: SusD/RagB family nutrient-binding outer membrane lipoprotein, partial [Flavobacteriaceae bacterium]|nr:SusD/RagB family nutrient-binding outer membrane lipoprotein [Flavobacteriaceae bacterium]